MKKLIALGPFLLLMLLAAEAHAVVRTINGYVRYENFRPHNTNAFYNNAIAARQPVTVRVVGGAVLSPPTLITDVNGYYCIVVDVPASGTLRLEVASSNSAAVFTSNPAAWTADVAIPAGTGAIDLSRTVSKADGAVRLNVLHNLGKAKAFADARRDDDDEIIQVKVAQPVSDTRYDETTGTIRLTNQNDPACSTANCNCSSYGLTTCGRDNAWEDVTIVHEYGHHLEYVISGDPMPMVATGNPCVGDSLMQTWHEGFPTYLGGVVGGGDGMYLNTALFHLEWALWCPSIGQFFPSFPIGQTSEEAVWSALYDAHDKGGDDELSLPGLDGELVFKIFDNELGAISTPTIHHFHDALVARNPYPNSHRDLDSVFAGNRVLQHTSPHAFADYAVQTINTSPSNIYRSTTVNLTTQLGNISSFGYDWTTTVPAEVRLDNTVVATFNVSAASGTWVGSASFVIPSNASFGSHSVSVRLPGVSVGSSFHESNTANNALSKTITVKGVCGDGICGGETCNTCEEDCGECEWIPPSCFVAGTPITMADGSTKPIEAVRVGDTVLSYDEATGALAPGSVQATMEHPDSTRLVVVNSTLVTTPEHPFWVDGRWVAAGQLRVGDALLTAASAQASPMLVPASVHSLEARSDSTTTYNFTVGRYHDYFAGGVLVHNKKPVDP
jgi:hypothetical protein